jgi:hypothetical protein
LIIFESAMMRAYKFCDNFHCPKSLLLHLVFGVTVVGIQVRRLKPRTRENKSEGEKCEGSGTQERS